MTTEHSPFDSLMRFYAAEARYSHSGKISDRESLLATLHPDIVLFQPASLPYGGEWRGRAQFGAWLDMFVETWAMITPSDPVFHECDPNLLISTVNMLATARETGVEIKMPMCQVIRFADGKPIEWHNYAWDTARMLEALRCQPD